MDYLTSGNAALLVLVNTVAAKCYMSFGFRAKMLGKSEKAKIAFKESDDFKTAHSKQLNDAEYGPLFVATLLYLHTQGINNKLVSGAAAFGSVCYMWSHFFGKLSKVLGPVGATSRFIALFGVIYEVHKSLK